MKKGFLKFTGILLIALLLVATGAPDAADLISVDKKATIEQVVSAPSAPTNLSLKLKKTSDEKITATASWSGSSYGYNCMLYAYDEFGGYQSYGGQTGECGLEHVFDHLQGRIYTYRIEVSSIDSSGNESSTVKKSTGYYMQGTYTKKAAKMIKKKTKGMSKYKKIKYAHDWIVKNYDYDGGFSPGSYTFEGSYKAKRAVCQGYALTMQVFMKELGIPVKCVCNKGEDHAWNMLKLSGKWYHVDATWDDPVGIESTTKKYPIYDFFLQSTKNLKKKKQKEQHTFKTKDYPSAKDTTYDNKGGTEGYKEYFPDNSGYYCDSTFSPWKNGKKQK